MENLLLDADRNLKLIDFGLSTSCAGVRQLSTQCGSPAYSAPELLAGKVYGKEVDVWSMYECPTTPFTSQNFQSLPPACLPPPRFLKAPPYPCVQSHLPFLVVFKYGRELSLPAILDIIVMRCSALE